MIGRACHQPLNIIENASVKIKPILISSIDCVSLQYHPQHVQLNCQFQMLIILNVSGRYVTKCAMILRLSGHVWCFSGDGAPIARVRI